MLELQPDPYHQLRCPLAQAWYRSSSTARHGPGRFLHCSLHGRSGAPSAADLSRRRQLLPCPAPHRPSTLAPAAARALPAPAQRARSGPCPPVPALAPSPPLHRPVPSRPVLFCPVPLAALAPFADMQLPALVLLSTLLAGTGGTALGQRWSRGTSQPRGSGERAGSEPRPVPSQGRGNMNGYRTPTGFVGRAQNLSQ